ncbi:MAG: glycosyltransferase [Cellulosilyticaceae bacterium]
MEAQTKKKKIIIDILFNIARWANLAVNEERLTKEWIDYRIDLFMNYTYQSLSMQTNQDFIVLLHYDPLSKALIDESLARYPRLSDNIIFTANHTQEILRQIEGYDRLYLLFFDSDNMLNLNYIQELHDIPDDGTLQAVVNPQGYIYEPSSQRVGTYVYRTSPFSVLIYLVDNYKKGQRYQFVKNNWDLYLELNHVMAKGDTFLILVHGQNVANKFDTFGQVMTRRITDGNEKEKILSQFGIKI